MAPLTPFLTETMFQNLRRSLPQGTPMSIHFLDIPPSVPAQPCDEQIEASVVRMQTVIELGRIIRERRNLPLRTPLRSLTVAHEDPVFIADLTGVLSMAAAIALEVKYLSVLFGQVPHHSRPCAGDLADYVKEELNVSALETAHPDTYGNMVLQPNFRALGERLGKSMGAVSKAVKGLSSKEMVEFKAEGKLTVAGFELGANDVRSAHFVAS
jgi:isoleucyl-tRNA synthetase